MKTKLLLLLAAFGLAGASARAQINITSNGQVYTQDFDGLPSTGTALTWTNNSTITGWYANAEDLADGYETGTGSSNSGDVYSFGAASNSERALGYLGSGGNDYTNFGLRLVNTSGVTLDGFTISYTGEQWRTGGVAPTNNNNYLNFSHRIFAAGAGSLPTSTSVVGWTAVAGLNFTPVTFTAAGALNGNLSGNQTSFTNVTVSGLTWNNGSELWLRWTGNDGSGSDAGLAIDNLTVTAIPEPSSIILVGVMGLAGLMVLRRKKK